MKYCNFDEKTGRILGFYEDNIHSEIPYPSKKLTEEQWQTAINNNHNKINEDGSTVLFDFRSTEEIAYLESLPTHEELDKMEYQAKLIENLMELGVL